MNPTTLLELWRQAAQQPFTGWDFTPLAGRYSEQTPPWSYDDYVRAHLKSSESVLDMGTGGGEKLLTFRDALPADTVATEGYLPNLSVAQAALAPHGISVVYYDSQTDAHMPFPTDRFALILNRHESFYASEIARVLKPGGVFITQQVDGLDLDDLYRLFGVETDYLHVNLANFQHQLLDAGLQVAIALDWAGTATFSDVAALVYYLHAVPWQAPADFSVDRYQEVLFALHHRPTLEFTMRRFLLVAQKSPTA